MFADAAIGMTQTGLDGRLLRVNRSFAELLGVEPSELVGRSDAEFTHSDDRTVDLWLSARLASGTSRCTAARSATSPSTAAPSTSS